MPKLIREIWLFIMVAFTASGALSYGFMLLSLPNDAAVIGGSLVVLTTIFGVGAVALRAGSMFWNALNKRNPSA